jgi:hypothetical protein
MVVAAMVLSLATTYLSYLLDRGNAYWAPVLHGFNYVVGFGLVILYVALLVGKVG